MRIYGAVVDICEDLKTACTGTDWQALITCLTKELNESEHNTFMNVLIKIGLINKQFHICRIRL